MLAKLKYSLLILVAVGQIQCFGQKGSDTTICLYNNEFDFLADAYVRFKYLQVDTFLNNMEISNLNLIIKEQSQKAYLDSSIIVNRQTALNGCKESYDKLAIRHDKQVKKNGRLKKILTTSVAVNAVLIIILVIAIL